MIEYNFEYMSEALLPTARWTIEQQQEQGQRHTKKPFLLSANGKADNLRGFSGRQLAWDRLEDLRKLTQLRGGVVEGQRMQHLFLAVELPVAFRCNQQQARCTTKRPHWPRRS